MSGHCISTDCYDEADDTPTLWITDGDDMGICGIHGDDDFAWMHARADGLRVRRVTFKPVAEEVEADVQSTDENEVDADEPD